ncbi:MAG: tRNA lysidine(34) synthetase TilS [Chloroflexota bacterium]
MHNQLVHPKGTILVAVSGGPDSLCLLDIFNRLPAHIVSAIHVAHLNHKLRGVDSDADAAFVADFAQRLRLPVTIEAIDVESFAQHHRRNLHQAAREIRYEFLARVADQIGAQSVAVAHHANDQAETVLMHLLRGAGTAGLRGIRPIIAWHEWQHWQDTSHTDRPERLTDSDVPTPYLIRPLLDITRADIEQYCREQQLAPRDDATNSDTYWTRNRIRHELLPQLANYNPHIVKALTHTAATCTDDYDFIRQSLEAIWSDLTHMRPDGIDFDGHIWSQLHPAIQREALRQAHRMFVPEQTLTWTQIEQARALVREGLVSKKCELPGALVLTVGYNHTFVIGAPAKPSVPQVMSASTPLVIPGRIQLRNGWFLTSHYVASVPTTTTKWDLYLDADKLDGALVVRYRQPGDRLRLAGGPGTRKIQDIFVDAKIPREQRAQWPIIATSEAVIWIAGMRVAGGFGVTSATQRILALSIQSEDQQTIG